MIVRLLAFLTLTAALASCATDVTQDATTGRARLAFQSAALHPGNGGLAIDASRLQPGDIILSSADGLNSAGVRLITLSPVSHASIYVDGEQVAEAVGHGVQRRSLAALLREESTVVAFRHPALRAEHLPKIHAFVQAHVGQKYNYVGVLLQAPFSVERRACELPVVPPPLRDACLQGVAAIQLGLGRNDQFFCSQFVLEAYRRAGVPLTDADPRLVSPGDLLHMREGDVPSIRIHQALQYVGHLKFQPADNAAR